MTTLVTSSPQMRIGCLISTSIKKAAFAALACIFAIAGAIVGFAAGAVIGPTKAVGCCNGARMGAFSGAVLAVEMLQATAGSGRWSLVSLHRENIETPTPVWNQTEKLTYPDYMNAVLKMEIFLSLVNGKAFQEWVGEALLAEHEAEVSFEDNPSLLDSGSMKGVPSESVKKLPEFVISSQERIKASADGKPCAICLQDFEEGDIARSLPRCCHHFHVNCIDKWLTLHGSCPICRQHVA